MTEVQKKKYFVLGLVFLAIVWILPTFIEDGLPDWWPSDKIRLGLDLKGGSYLVLGVQSKEAVKSQLNSIAGAMKSDLRKSRAGVVRAKQVEDDQIKITLLRDSGIPVVQNYVSENYPNLISLPNDKNGSRVVMGYQLAPQSVAEIENDAVLQAIEVIRNRVDGMGVAEPTIQRVGDKRILVQLPDITDLDQVRKTIGRVAKLEFRLEPKTNTPLAEQISLKSKRGGEVQVEDEILMTGDAIETAKVATNPDNGQFEIDFTLNGLGAKTFGRVTKESIGRNLAIVLDNVVQSSPVIQGAITGGRGQITGNFTQQEAHELAVVLRSGALPAPLSYEEERTIGATLGEDSINKGVMSMLVGSAIVILFVMFYYKKSGVLAVACLIVNMLFILAMLAGLGATLTLPGIAGLILTIGMAVDANVIIFERIREELGVGATPKASIEAGFSKAHWTILDANITTLITGVILYQFGTGPIKGFAVTLCLGIIASVFTALYVARLGFQTFDMKGARKGLSI